ncbi:MAG: signal peptidase II [Syntrophobacterales bacterium]|jgi:signal peptidase II|nr:signal peptidase II [Syntrophobacterales bacterium]
MKKYGFFLITILVIFTMDQLTKWWVVDSMSLHESIPVLEGFFHLTYVRNPGAAFGFLAGMDPLFRSIFFISANIMAMGLILFYLFKTDQRSSLLILGLSLIMAGALGNLMDRLRFGEVVDFLDFFLGSWHWPAFNVADAAITTGALLLIREILRADKKSKEEETTQAAL